MNLTRKRAVMGMVVVAFLWSLAGVATRQLDTSSSFEITFWRSFFTSASLLLILPVFQGRATFSNMRRAGWPLWASGLCWAVMFTGFMLALTMTTTANVLVTLALGPFLAALIARLCIGYRIPLRTWCAIAVAGGGVAYMYGAQLDESGFAGTLVALSVPIAGGFNWTITHRLQGRAQQVDLVSAVLIGAMISAVATLPLALPFRASSQDVGLLALLGLVQLAIPCSLAMVFARVLKAHEIALLALLEVVFGIALVWLGAGEAPGEGVIGGGALIVSAVVADELAGRRRRSSVEARRGA